MDIKKFAASKVRHDSLALLMLLLLLPLPVDVMPRVVCLDSVYQPMRCNAQGFEGMLMDKINVNGKDASPVYNYLKVWLRCC